MIFGYPQSKESGRSAWMKTQTNWIICSRVRYLRKEKTLTKIHDDNYEADDKDVDGNYDGDNENDDNNVDDDENDGNDGDDNHVDGNDVDLTFSTRGTAASWVQKRRGNSRGTSPVFKW